MAKTAASGAFTFSSLGLDILSLNPGVGADPVRLGDAGKRLGYGGQISMSDLRLCSGITVSCGSVTGKFAGQTGASQQSDLTFVYGDFGRNGTEDTSLYQILGSDSAGFARLRGAITVSNASPPEFRTEIYWSSQYLTGTWDPSPQFSATNVTRLAIANNDYTHAIDDRFEYNYTSAQWFDEVYWTSNKRIGFDANTYAFPSSGLVGVGLKWAS